MRFRSLSDECRQIRMNLPDELFNESDGSSPSGLFEHISHCRSCLEAYIALLAAAELADPANDSEHR